MCNFWFQARLRMSDIVIDDDVNEAIRLVEKSRDSINPGNHILNYPLAQGIVTNFIYFVTCRKKSSSKP